MICSLINFPVILVLNSGDDLVGYYTWYTHRLIFSAEPGEYEIRKPKTVFSTKFLLMPQDMENYVFGQESSRYIREVW